MWPRPSSPSRTRTWPSWISPSRPPWAPRRWRRSSVQQALYGLAALLVLLGLVGLVLPVLPGGALVFAGILALAWADGFTRIGLAPLLICALLTVLMAVAQ